MNVDVHRVLDMRTRTAQFTVSDAVQLAPGAKHWHAAASSAMNTVPMPRRAGP
jgi:hypothetical protein